MNKIFVTVSEDIKRLLLDIKKKADADELIVAKKDWENKVVELKNKNFPVLFLQFAKLNNIVETFNDDDFELHKNYIRSLLLNLFSSPSMPLNWQITQKPLGYAGDYVVADYFYNKGFSGSTIYSMFMDRFTVESPLATAHRNRKKYLSKLLCRLADNQEGRLRVSSFACGPAAEVFDVLEKGVSNIDYNLIDGELRAIEFLESRITKYDGVSDAISLHHENILNLVRKEQTLNIADQHLIYCAGFFDYIKDSTARRLIKYMLKMLSSNGWLVIVNVSMHDVNDVCLRMLSDWDLHHRSKQALASLADDLECISQRKVWSDYHTKRNLYLVIKK